MVPAIRSLLTFMHKKEIEKISFIVKSVIDFFEFMGYDANV